MRLTGEHKQVLDEIWSEGIKSGWLNWNGVVTTRGWYVYSAKDGGRRLVTDADGREYVLADRSEPDWEAGATFGTLYNQVCEAYDAPHIMIVYNNMTGRFDLELQGREVNQQDWLTEPLVLGAMSPVHGLLLALRQAHEGDCDG